MRNGLHVDADGNRRWFVNDRFHREDGPAVEYANGSREWWLNGKQYTFEKWLEHNDAIAEKYKTVLRLRYGLEKESSSR